MKVTLVTPAGKRSRAGNRATAVRWARILRSLGCRVQVVEPDDGSTDLGAHADMMIAVHAWRSAAAIRRFATTHPDKPLIVLLAGTDIYRFQDSHPEETRASMAAADRLVCLHDLVHRAIPAEFHGKLRVIHQSAHPLPGPRRPSPRYFEVCVAGHLRWEKDSLRAAEAARLVPEGSRLRVVALGKAHDADWEAAAYDEAATNPRFVWRGEVSRAQVRRQFARSHALVISSVMEGGANVVSEAIVAGLPVIASHIDGNVGLLGEDYEGYYRAQDAEALAALLHRAETEPQFLASLERQARSREPLFRPERETAAWQALLRDLPVTAGS